MEIKDLNLNLRLLCEVKMHLEQGRAVNVALRAYREKYQDEVADFILQWEVKLVSQHNTRIQQLTTYETLRPATRKLLALVERSLRGESILPILREFEAELLELLYAESEEHAAKLPIYQTLPLLLLIFPAFMILVLGPVVTDLINGLSR